jgi:predicted glycosyltransferase involved in capsule biosynthesis
MRNPDKQVIKKIMRDYFVLFICFQNWNTKNDEEEVSDKILVNGIRRCETNISSFADVRTILFNSIVFSCTFQMANTEWSSAKINNFIRSAIIVLNREQQEKLRCATVCSSSEWSVSIWRSWLVWASMTKKDEPREYTLTEWCCNSFVW